MAVAAAVVGKMERREGRRIELSVLSVGRASMCSTRLGSGE